MATYVGLIQFADQGIRNIKDTVKRGDAAIAEAESDIKQRYVHPEKTADRPGADRDEPDPYREAEQPE